MRNSHGTIVQRRTARSHESSSCPLASAAMPNANGMVMPDEADVEHRRVDRHVVVLQQRVQALAIRVRRREERRERVVVDHHQEEEEHLHDGDRGDDPGNQQPVALAIHVHRHAAERREQRDPEHDRAVEPAPVRRELVEERLRGVRVVLNVSNGEVAGDEGVHHDRRRDEHDRRDDVEEADAAEDQGVLTAPGAREGRRERAARDDERREQKERAEAGH